MAELKPLLIGKRIAWPTIALFLTAWLLIGFASVGFLAGRMPAWGTVLINALAIYALFTCLHDASHASIGGPPWLGLWIGRLSAFPLLGPFRLFRRIHLRHHAWTNHPDNDPDYWVTSRHWVWLPFKWATLNLHYYAWLLKPSFGQHFQRVDIVEAVATIGLIVLVYLGALATGYGWDLVVVWTIPAQVAVFCLALLFDFIPHYPFAQIGRYRDTRALPGWWANWVTFGQNFHLAHHLWPAVPWYRYGRAFYTKEAELRARGCAITPLV